eukprot:346539-Chlamydomonas_euryale.AAC.3
MGDRGASGVPSCHGQKPRSILRSCCAAIRAVGRASTREYAWRGSVGMASCLCHGWQAESAGGSDGVEP